MIVEVNAPFLEVVRRVAFDKVAKEDLDSGAPVLRTIRILELDGSWLTAQLYVPSGLHTPSCHAAYLMTLRIKPGVRAREIPVLYYSDIVIGGESISLKLAASPSLFRIQ